MAYNPQQYRAYPGAPGAAASAAVLDAGLRAYMLRVYNWMTSGLVLTGIVAYAISHTSLIEAFFHRNAAGQIVPTGLALVAMFAPLGFVLVLSFGINKLSRGAAQALYWAYCASVGASLTSLFITYTAQSIGSVFFVTAATFAAMSIYGYTTRADLSRFGSFLFMGLIGIIIASLVNAFFVHSGPLQMMVSIIGVLVFTGLTAFDTQRIKADYVQYAYAYGPDDAAKRSVYDALSLYLNFINLFMLLMNLMGNRNSN